MRKRLAEIAFCAIVFLSVFLLGVIHAYYLQGRFNQ